MRNKLLLVCFAAGFSVAANAADGEKVYNDNCKGCHSSEFVKAPKLGKKEDWEKRLGQGTETMVKNVVNGMKSDAGMMPPRGGNPKLSDEELTAAVEFIVKSAK